jgi:hypothetical protein
MSKRDKKTITIGSAVPYCMPYTDTVPTVEEICKDEYLLGYIKSGAGLEYTEETYEEKDDLGYVSKIITTSEEALLKMGLITWNGTTLQQLIDRCKVTEEAGKRITKIGGPGNAQGKYYAICLHHKDTVDGDLYVLIVGRNTAGATLTLAADEGTLIEPEFKAIPHDDDGTLVQLIEMLPAA